MNLNRREAVQRLTLLLGGVLSAQVTAALHGEVLNIGASVKVDAGTEALLADVADTIIPDTGTPGAKAAGAEKFILRVMRDCYRYEDQRDFYAGLAGLDAAAKAGGAKGFSQLDPAARAETLKAYAEKNRTFFKTMRELTVVGYFTSEIGATKALAYLPIPGRFEGDIALEPGQKTWVL
jgi:hypothetical protein